METVAFCELDNFCQKVLRKHWPDVPIFDNIKTLKGDDVGPVDLICGGYPCQPFSLAGKRCGQEDDRHLWPEMLRIIKEVRPSWVIAENVTGHITMGLDTVLSDLEGEGYTVLPLVIPAVAVDAPHKRSRVWIIANNNGYKLRQQQKLECRREGPSITANNGETQSLANPNSSDGEAGRNEARREEKSNTNRRSARAVMANPESVNVRRGNGIETEGQREKPREGDCGDWRPWPTESGVGRVVDGFPGRMDRIRALGNAVVPRIPEMIGRAIMGTI